MLLYSIALYRIEILHDVFFHVSSEIGHVDDFDSWVPGTNNFSNRGIAMVLLIWLALKFGIYLICLYYR